MLISIFMPTRNRFDWLHRALKSIRDTNTDADKVEILLRIDDDDHERIALIPELERLYAITPVVGPRGKGYINMGGFVDDMARVANGKWAWLFDDDSWVEGQWQDALAGITPTENGPAVHAEFYCLGHSEYRNGATGGPPGLIVPMSLPKSLSHRNPVDEQWLSVIMARKWNIELLPGVRYCHEGRPR